MVLQSSREGFSACPQFMESCCHDSFIKQKACRGPCNSSNFNPEWWESTTGQIVPICFISILMATREWIRGETSVLIWVSIIYLFPASFPLSINFTFYSPTGRSKGLHQSVWDWVVCSFTLLPPPVSSKMEADLDFINQIHFIDIIMIFFFTICASRLLKSSLLKSAFTYHCNFLSTFSQKKYINTVVLWDMKPILILGLPTLFEFENRILNKEIFLLTLPPVCRYFLHVLYGFYIMTHFGTYITP